MISKIGKYIPSIFLITFLLVFVVCCISIKEVTGIISDHQWVTHTYQVINTIDTTTEDIAKGEIYGLIAISAGADTTGVYGRSWQNIQTNIQRLKQLTSDNISQQKRIQDLEKEVQALKRMLDSQIAQGPSVYPQAVAQTRQQESAIFTQTQQIMHGENVLLGSRNTSFFISVWSLIGISIISSLFILCLLLLVFEAMRKELQQRTILEQKKNEFIVLIAHELKTPITTMSIFTEVLQKKVAPKDKKTLHILSTMKFQVNEMVNMINDLLDATRIQLGKLEIKKETTLLNTILTEAVKDIQATTKIHKIILKKSRNIFVRADKQRIWQVVVNLLTNAVKYSPNGGEITLTLTKEKRQALVRIADPGIGIDKANQKNIFDRYFREEGSSEQHFSGMGLGLYLAKQIILLHRGKIWVKSKPGKGTTFFFTVPLSKKGIRAKAM